MAKWIMIVDDDTANLKTAGTILSKNNMYVTALKSGRAMLDYIREKGFPDLILLDYEMPIANGPQVLSMLKNDSETGQIPVMFLTGHGDKESVLSVIGLNPVDYLLKTIDKETLLAKLNAFFSKK